jgi:alpha-L-rhamnosidase
MKPYRPFVRAVSVWPQKLSGRMNTWVSFHARVELPGRRGATLRIAAAQAYRVWVDGVLVGRGPARTAHGHARVDEWPVAADATGLLRMVIEVMEYGVPTFCSTNEPAFCCAEIVSGKKILAWTAPRDGGFMAEQRTEHVQKIERFSYQRAFAEGYHVRRDGFTWREPGYAPKRPLPLARVNYARTWLPRGVAYPDLSVVRPKVAAVTGRALPYREAVFAKAEKWRHIFDVPKTSPGFTIEQQEWPVFTALAGTTFESTGTARLKPGVPLTLRPRAWLRASFGGICTGFPAVRAYSRKGARLLLVFDEILVDGQIKFDRSSCENVIWLDLAPGAAVDFEAFEPYTFQHLQVIAWEGTVEVSGLRLRHYQNGTVLRDGPHSLTPAAARVRRAALASYRQNALDLFMDCPGRERAGWLCDSLFTARAEWHLTGDNRIERAFLQNYLVMPPRPELPRGMVPMCYPAEPLKNEFIPNWAMFLVIQLDEARRVRRLPAEWQPLIKRRVQGLVDYFRPFENERGLLEKLDSWIFVEWSKANDFVKEVNFPTNMLYAMMLRSAARLLREPKLAAQADRIDATVRELSWRDGVFLDHAVRDHHGQLVVRNDASEVCQYYAFFTGLATPRREPALWQRLVRADYGPLLPANVFVGKIMRFQLLIENGEFEAARRELLKSYLPMAKMTGTLWELFQKNVSCNHGFTSYVAVLIDQLAARKRT